jgi:hypothetical protein
MELKDILTVIIGAAALVFTAVSVIQGLIEYKKQGISKRAEAFLQMRERLREDPVFVRICALLETDSKELQDVPLIEKDRFVGFFEELALMKNSGLVNDQVALYMFGYFAIRCSKSRNFWHGLNKEQALWSLFWDFARQMETAQEKFHFERKNFHL